MSRRTERVAHLIQREIGDVILKELTDVRIGFVTISRVEVTTDMAFAKVHVSIMGTDKQKRDSMAGLAHSASYLRTHLAKVMKMRTVPLRVEESMDFTLVGTAVRVEGLPPSEEPIVATVPALEFVKLLDADVVPTGIAVGAHYEWYADWQGDANKRWMGNVESVQLSRLWERVRQRAHADLRKHARDQGNGVLAHINFSQMFEGEGSEALRSKQYLARHIVIATTVDARRGARFSHEINIAVDMHAGGTPLTGTARHHQSYQVNEEEGGI